MFRKIGDLRIDKFFDMEIDMNLCDVKLKERLVEIFKKVNVDVVKFYEENKQYFGFTLVEGAIYKNQKERLEKLIEEIAIEKKKFASSEKVKFNIGDTVTLKYTEGLGASPFISMCRAYEITSLDNSKARISDDKISFVVPLEALQKTGEPIDELKFKIDIIIDESFMEKLKEEKEEIKIIRNLEDLNEHKNSNGLYLSYSAECDEHDELLQIMGVNGDTGIFIIESNLWALKGMGFEFDYKPKRTEEEIMGDLVEKTFKFGEGNYILIKHEHGCYDYMNNTSFYTPGQKYYSLESLKKVVKELNEIQED